MDHSYLESDEDEDEDYSEYFLYKKYDDNNNDIDILGGHSSYNMRNVLESRPHISSNQEEYIINKLEKDEVLRKETSEIKNKRKQKKETIMNISLGDIFKNISNVITNFWSNYKESLVEVKYNIDEDIYSDDSVSFISLSKIHLFAFVNYLKKDNNIIYMGIFLIIISILLYFINITRR